MTTVAFDGCTLAADSKSVDTHGLCDKVPKLFDTGALLVAGAGTYDNILNWVDWIKRQDSEILFSVQKHMDACSGIVIVKASGSCYKLSGKRLVKISRRFHAIGSGRDYALAAMHLGKNAVEAVKIASLFDNDTDDMVDSHHLIFGEK